MTAVIKSLVPGAAMLMLAVSAHAGFYIEGSPTLSTERTSMGRYQPYESSADARFRQPTASMQPKQARYADAELLVDLAYKPVTQIGTGRAEVVDGFADDVPFTAAMSMIVPTGWQIYKSKALDEKAVPKMVGYSGGKPWPDVLGQVAERYALQFNIDWNQRTIMINKGRESALSQASRIKVIPEPPRTVAASVPRPGMAGASSTITSAVATAAPSTAPISTGSAVAKGTSQPDKSIAPKAVAANAAPAAPKVEPIPTKPLPPPVPVEVALDVLPGTLRGNLERLSAKQGWNPPAWQIEADYRIDAGYTLRGNTFEEVIAKLLLLHPVYADIRQAERKVYVTGEVK